MKKSKEIELSLPEARRDLAVSIIIVSYKNAAILRLCLDALKKNISSALNYEIIVVDNESQEEIRDLVREEYPTVKFLEFRENLGLAKGLNEGIAISKGETVLALNPDIIIHPGAVEELYDYVSKHKQTGIAGPMLLNFNGSYQPSCFNFYTPLTVVYRRTFLGRFPFGRKALKSFILHPKGEEPQAIKGWLMGSALMVRRDNLMKVGLMNEHYFMYFEDVDWCRRFLEAGFQVVYVPKAKMFHYHAKVSASKSIFSILVNKMTMIHFLSGLKYFLHFGGWQVRIPKKSAKD